MKTIKTPILPIQKTIAKSNGLHELDLEAICLFVAFGFFFDTDTYWKDEVVLAPGTLNKLDENNRLISSEKWFDWHYTPRDISFNEALQEFTTLFEIIVQEQTQGKHVILPISGGLDSRTQAVALRNHPNVKSYSYDYDGGYPETKIAKQIAAACGFSFESFKVEQGYLWDCIEELAKINECYSEFTHPRQMAFFDALGDMGNLFSLGHMGDLLFDSFGLPQLSLEEGLDEIIKLLLKKSGAELAHLLWEAWGLEGNFEDYYRSRLRAMLEDISIVDTNAKLRAFKTRYFVSRWSSNNLSVFEAMQPVALPYYDNRMFEFICTIPENYLSNRQLQIAYIQQTYPELAKITWQAQRPFNLTNYHLNKSPYNLPYRISNKLKRELKELLGKPYITRNWELQFVGADNDRYLKEWLFNSNLKDLVPTKITEAIYTNFKSKDAVTYSHSVSMLLTLALFQELFNE
ncbi:asparagine synthase [Winogradskyella wandonensis]|uniref:asparagine synthase (glutamine-hydrolyzing) n=1 Tax=Winogradskyella wandonensis TaxID=1442586 RepID=A0A4R1KVT8_9FLAO|nr:asparagine synthase-related protein [Winogradskyella wandonensis]TCK68830.1 asparagine synthase [Winogradskyella wandonensis]